MKMKSESFVYLSIAILLCAFLTLLVFLGPIGWITAILLLIGLYPLLKWSGFFEEQEQSAPTKRNCEACGARNSIERQECSYCGEPLETTSSS